MSSINMSIDLSQRQSNWTAIIVAKDIDILDLLIGLKSLYLNIYFMKPSTGPANMKLYCTTSLKLPLQMQHILFLHIFTGCDTTSHFRRQKTKIVKHFIKVKRLQEAAEVFRDPETHHITLIG